MRIRKGRSPPPPPLPPSQMPKPRFGHSFFRQDSHFDARFSVEEANRCLGLSFYPLKNTHGRKKNLHVELHQPEMEALNHIDKKKHKKHCMREIPCQAPRGRHDEKAIAKGSTSCTSYRGNGKSSNSNVTSVAACPSAYSQPGKELPLKQRGYNYQWSGEKVSKEEEGDKVTTVKTKTMETHEQEDIDEDYHNQKTKSISSIMNCNSAMPHPTIDNLQMHHGQQDSVSRGTTVEQKEKPRRGRKRKADDADGNGPIECEGEQKRKRGRPKKVKDQLINGNDEYVEKQKQKQKRGRPKKVKYQPINVNKESSFHGLDYEHDPDYKPTYR